MRIPDRTGVVAGYRVWRVIPSRWVEPSRSLQAESWHRPWSLAGPTVAYCPPRVRIAPDKPLLADGPCEDAPGFDCACGLYARYEPLREPRLLPYVAGSVLAWGRVVHHERRSFFRAEKAIPVAFVRPRGGSGMFTEEAEEKLLRVAEALGAGMVEDQTELWQYTQEEARGW